MRKYSANPMQIMSTHRVTRDLSPLIFNLDTLDMSGPLHDLAAWPPAKECLVPIESGVWWVPEAVWPTWRREAGFVGVRYRNSDRPLPNYFSRILNTLRTGDADLRF